MPGFQELDELLHAATENTVKMIGTHECHHCRDLYDPKYGGSNNYCKACCNRKDIPWEKIMGYNPFCKHCGTDGRCVKSYGLWHLSRLWGKWEGGWCRLIDGGRLALVAGKTVESARGCPGRENPIMPSNPPLSNPSGLLAGGIIGAQAGSPPITGSLGWITCPACGGHVFSPAHHHCPVADESTSVPTKCTLCSRRRYITEVDTSCVSIACIDKPDQAPRYFGYPWDNDQPPDWCPRWPENQSGVMHQSLVPQGVVTFSSDPEVKLDQTNQGCGKRKLVL
jgi:hypothetical protein